MCKFILEYEIICIKCQFNAAQYSEFSNFFSVIRQTLSQLGRFCWNGDLF